MKKLVPGPPVLRIRPDLPLDEALNYACDHLACALAIAQEAARCAPLKGMVMVRSAVYQIEIAHALVEQSRSNLPRPSL